MQIHWTIGLPQWLSSKESAFNEEPQEMRVRSLGQEDPLEEGMANPLQYSCLENPMDRGGWQDIVHKVANPTEAT